MKPPRIAIWLLERLLPEADRDAIVGDLVEESALRARASTRIRGRVSAADESVEKGARLLSVHKAGERGILPKQTFDEPYVDCGDHENSGYAL